MARIKTPEELEQVRQEYCPKGSNKPCISVCVGAGCVASGADDVCCL